MYAIYISAIKDGLAMLKAGEKPPEKPPVMPIISRAGSPPREPRKPRELVIGND
jgi:hypothetical protein